MGVDSAAARKILDRAIQMEERGDLQGARSAYQQAAALGSGTQIAARAELLVGNVHILLGEPQAGFQALRRAYQSGDPDIAPKATYALGMFYEHSGDMTGARLAYEAALESGDSMVAPLAAAKLRALAS